MEQDSEPDDKYFLVRASAAVAIGVAYRWLIVWVLEFYEGLIQGLFNVDSIVAIGGYTHLFVAETVISIPFVLALKRLGSERIYTLFGLAFAAYVAIRFRYHLIDLASYFSDIPPFWPHDLADLLGMPLAFSILIVMSHYRAKVSSAE